MLRPVAAQMVFNVTNVTSLNQAISTIDTAGKNFSGMIGGASGLTKTGIGTLTLAGTDTYAGATTVNGGTLRAGAASAFAGISIFTVASGAVMDLNGFAETVGSLAGAGTVTMEAGSLTIDGNNTNTVFAGAITGSGGLTKTGTGIVALNGANTYTGLTTVAGGTLAGEGSILGAVMNMSGTVAPGVAGTSGTFRVGQYTQGAGGILAIEVSPATASQLKVTGTASLAGKLELVFDPGIYTAKTYPLLTASSVTGSFASITGTVPTQGLTQAVKPSSTEVDLVLSSTSTPTPTPTPRQVVIAPSNATLPTNLETASARRAIR